MRLEAKDIHKHYGPKKANAGISLIIEAGNIHGVLGENGAGKSTLMKIISGYTTRTSGTILLTAGPGSINRRQKPPGSVSACSTRSLSISPR